MDPVEYLAIVPLLIYGIGLTDLLKQWKRVFKKEDRYPLYIIYTIILTEVAIYNVVIYIDLVEGFTHLSYFQYLSCLLPPILFMIVVDVFTPDDGVHTKQYFTENSRLIFTLTAIYVASHALFSFREITSLFYFRLVFVVLLLVTAYFRKEWLMYVLAALWFISVFLRGSMVAA